MRPTVASCFAAAVSAAVAITAVIASAASPSPAPSPAPTAPAVATELSGKGLDQYAARVRQAAGEAMARGASYRQVARELEQTLRRIQKLKVPSKHALADQAAAPLHILNCDDSNVRCADGTCKPSCP